MAASAWGRIPQTVRIQLGNVGIRGPEDSSAFVFMVDPVDDDDVQSFLDQVCGNDPGIDRAELWDNLERALIQSWPAANATHRRRSRVHKAEMAAVIMKGDRDREHSAHNSKQLGEGTRPDRIALHKRRHPLIHREKCCVAIG